MSWKDQWRSRAPQRIRDSLGRARSGPGPERDTALLLLKSGAAGVLAWGLAQYVIASPQPTYAPFTALLVVQSTAYRSLMQSFRYVLAVVLGVVAAGLVGPLLGENAGAFAVMLAITLVLGRWQRLGSQGLQVSVAGVFAYNALLGTRESMLWEIIMMALLGAGVGIGISMFVLPPLRYRTAASGVEEVSNATQTLLKDMADGLDDGLPDSETAEDWLHRARQLDDTLASAREAVEHGAESVVLNPRRLLHPRSVPRSFAGYRTLMESLGRAGEQIRSIAYGLLRVREQDPSVCPSADFLRAYGELLATLSRAAGLIGSLQESMEEAEEGAKGEDPLIDTLERGREQHRRLADEAEGAAWPSHGVLLTDADRLLVEFGHAHEQGATQPLCEE
ncbi:aromatic acid exporter family protein [Streptomyces sp. NBC_01775]|uniref:FUSC family protein n=1 Tax=Streptomyces sp. NBC_01775 TaxID=2975939 RepID=UPI002DD9A381|nr:aromatic acid exporter family protein [Streptomyces sp. NBC_01775]WSB80401.1 aromatic acid exporter family protein [Streptomyces sp. NBC_01775]